MSHFDPESLGYFDAVQVFFTEITGRGVMLGGRDIDLLESWREQGADARLVCRGIQEAVAEMPDDEPPRNIRACKRWVEELIERAREGKAGAHELDLSVGPGRAESSTPKQTDGGRDDETVSAEESDPEGDAPSIDGPPIIVDALDTVEDAGGDARTEAIRDAYRHAWRRLKDVISGEADSSPFEALADIEDDLVERYYRALDDEARSELDERLEREKDGRLDRMTAEARERPLLARKRKLLIEHHGFTPIT